MKATIFIFISSLVIYSALGIGISRGQNAQLIQMDQDQIQIQFSSNAFKSLFTQDEASAEEQPPVDAPQEQPAAEEPQFEAPLEQPPAEEAAYEAPLEEAQPPAEEPVYEAPLEEAQPPAEEPVYEAPLEEAQPSAEEPVYEAPLEEAQPPAEEPVYEAPLEEEQPPAEEPVYEAPLEEEQPPAEEPVYEAPLEGEQLPLEEPLYLEEAQPPVEEPVYEAPLEEEQLPEELPEPSELTVIPPPIMAEPIEPQYVPEDDLDLPASVDRDSFEFVQSVFEKVGVPEASDPRFIVDILIYLQQRFAGSGSADNAPEYTDLNQQDFDALTDGVQGAGELRLPFTPPGLDFASARASEAPSQPAAYTPFTEFITMKFRESSLDL